MKSFCLCTKYETLIIMRLAGIAGKEVYTRDQALEMLETLLKDPEYGLIVVSESVLDMAKEEIMAIKLKDKETLIVHIPEPEGLREKSHIMKYIRESIGIKV